MVYNPRRSDLDGSRKSRKVRIRGIALPNEHGSWGILLEPVVAALAVAPSAAGVYIAIAVIGAFLLRQPLRILISDLVTGRNLPQTRVAGLLAAVACAVAAAGLLAAFLSTNPANLLPVSALVPFGAFQLFNDVSRRSRELVPELAGAAALSASAPAIALAAGWHPAEAAALGCIFAARSIPSFVYIRQRLRLEKGKDFRSLPSAVLHLLALGACIVLAIYGLIPLLPLTMFAFLLWRAVRGLSKGRTKMKAVQLGIRETVYGAMLVLTVVLGYYLGAWGTGN